MATCHGYCAFFNCVSYCGMSCGDYACTGGSATVCHGAECYTGCGGSCGGNCQNGCSGHCDSNGCYSSCDNWCLGICKNSGTHESSMCGSSSCSATDRTKT